MKVFFCYCICGFLYIRISNHFGEEIMEKKIYAEPELEVTEFETEDVIARSCTEVNYTCEAQNWSEFSVPAGSKSVEFFRRIISQRQLYGFP